MGPRFGEYCSCFKAPANGTFYNGGIEKNLEAMRRHYPAGFVMRIYHDFEFDEEKKDEDDGRLEVLCRISCGNADLDLCDARDIGGGLINEIVNLLSCPTR